MIDFHAMGARQAKAYLQAWVATTPVRRQWLAESLLADGRGHLGEDLHSLRAVADWLEARARLRDGVVLGGRMPDLSDVDPKAVPSWFDGTAAGAWMFDDWSNWAIDAAALNFGHVVTALDPQITWIVDRQRTRGYIDQNRPSLVRPGDGSPVNPVAVYVGALLTVHTRGIAARDCVEEALVRLGLS